MSDPGTFVRDYVAEVLGELVDASSVPLLINVLSDLNRNGGDSVAKLLDKLGNRSAIPALVDAPSDTDDCVRMATSEALAGFRSTSAVPVLIELLSNSNRNGLDCASNSLRKLGDKSA